MTQAAIAEFKEQVITELRMTHYLTPKRKRRKPVPVPGARVWILEGESKHGKGVNGQEKWKECPFGEMEIGDSFIIRGKKTMVNSRLFTWALYNDKRREKKFWINEEQGLVVCTRTE